MEDEEEEGQRQRAASRRGQLLMAASMVVIDFVEERIVGAGRDEKDVDSWRAKRPSSRHSSYSNQPKTRSKRRVFDHHGARNCMERDHLGPDALFGQEVLLFFRLSRPRVQFILEAFGNSGDPYYSGFRKCKFGRVGPSLEAKVLLPLRVLAYGVAPHTFNDYFQMSISMARSSVMRFNRKVVELFSSEYMRLPTVQDLQEITTLHKKVHGVDGMLGSLDCMHTYWKNCPVAWQQSYKGKKSGPSIVLEAVADHYLWFWHVSYGYSGALNDLNILNLSPLMGRMTDGSFSSLEKEAGVVPFTIEGEEFDKLYVLVDGIYPKYSRFVRGFTEPITAEETRFTGWQESARKDIERAFGVLQCKFKAIANPIHLIELESISMMVSCCLVLHNMAVSDRVMGDVSKRYSPSTKEGVRLQQEEIVEEVGVQEEAQESSSAGHHGAVTTTVRSFDVDLAETVANRKKNGWQSLKDPREWARLQSALIQLKGQKTTTSTSSI